jgi:hypothetical protein
LSVVYIQLLQLNLSLQQKTNPLQEKVPDILYISFFLFLYPTYLHITFKIFLKLFSIFFFFSLHIYIYTCSQEQVYAALDNDIQRERLHQYDKAIMISNPDPSVKQFKESQICKYECKGRVSARQ